MTVAISRPFNQKIRIAALRVIFASLLPLVIFTRTGWGMTGGMALETVGILAIFVAILGRFWAILYIGGRKNAVLMQEGPYSICRHPLYLFSTIGVTGFGLMLGSVTLALCLGGTAFFIMSMTAAREERFLSETFGGRFCLYAAQVPRMLPAWRLFRTSERVTVDVGTLSRNAADALVFISLIPLAELFRWIAALQIFPSIALF
ncbi:isoprenylcysteine carboxylmethyltransferase family protein [Paracoccus sp. JM45]|uniref:methyltransferase family protein n=1 Tax=Paracoccus sp. JM45 TaxID=2283626 RepID=UPI000E6BFFFA|nr:isoprenylcysteine carboxylmethyltransferase family protein [Paracoccus sp. JM45]RJE78493.1 isoprenylcysteine carboxylmethyltransferase family protein [Paracoccus sp. JM45]